MIDSPGSDEGPDADDARPAPPFAGNQLGGVVFGSSVQARDIQGDLIFHQPQRSLPLQQLPPVPRLSGRAAELAMLDTARADRLVALSGPPGIGKTALALH